MTSEASDILPLHLFIERGRNSSHHYGSRLGRDIQLSQMAGSHVPDNVELGSNLMPPRDNEAASTLDVISSFSRAEPAADDAGHMATLTPSCFSLVLMCAVHNVNLWVPLILVIPVSIAQTSVLYIVTFKSPEYLFGSGRWLLPVSASKSLNAMKAFASILMLGQIAEEFYEIGESASVLRRSRLEKNWRWYTCWLVVAMQYLLALMVLVAADHLILSRERPIEPLWITYYVFMTLNFDNMLVRFISYVRTMERAPAWKVDVYEPTSPTSADHVRRSDHMQRLFLVWIPVAVAISLNISSRVFNILPITLLRYGSVTNDRPVVMMTPSVGLPHSCCPAEAVWNGTLSEESIKFSIPCLSRDAPEDLVAAPVVYWVAWPRRRGTPTSLQVREGRGADGSRGIVSGRATATPLQLEFWLQRHGYGVSQAADIFNALTDTNKRIGMYHFAFPYVAEFSVSKWPWKENAAIYAVAVNMATGALSPEPVSSDVLLRFDGKCGPHCMRCSHQGICRHCKAGFRPDGPTCVPCGQGCQKCDAHPVSSECSECQAGYGLTRMGLMHCLPCAARDCANCNEEDDSQAHEATARELPCRSCLEGHGLATDGSCFPCKQKNCKLCDENRCKQCQSGFAVVEDDNATRCDPCGEACLHCDKPGSCQHCQDGYAKQEDGHCKPCGDFCIHCHDRKGDGCDEGGCQSGYGLQGGQFAWRPRSICKPCRVQHCSVCDISEHSCDSCQEDFGITPSGHCAVCGPGCVECKVATACEKCDAGFVLVNGACHACADKCMSCTVSGPGSCDKHSCAKAWTAILLPKRTWHSTEESWVCRPCSDPDCERCDVQGPGGCDDKATYGPWLPPGI
ncbi:Pcsk5 [Symbiodinium sp. CCMP2456]|nr:Pcsk5 [Symbiodinium sp. CCMP2456]